MLLGEGGPHERGEEKEASLLKRRFFTAIGLSSVKTVTDRHRHAAHHNRH